MKTTLLTLISILAFSYNSVLSQDCVDIPNLPSSQINSNINDDVNYPVGTPYWSEGNIDFIKTPNTLTWNHQPGDTTLCTSNGNVVFSFANATDPKTLYISMAYEYGLIVDGDTIFDNANPPATYNGSNFDLTYSQNPFLSEYTITGDFDTLEILANNLCIYELCLEEGVSTEDCVDIPNLPSNQINANINDDVNYPVGTPYWSEGNIDFIKTPNMGPWSHQAGDTSLCTSSGNVVFSLANASDPKTFYITMTYEYGLVIDGDTVFDNSNPPASYTGSNFNLTSTQNAMISDYTITGDFDTVEILANNLCIYEICLEEEALTENCVDIPNLPSNQINANINDDVNYPVGTPFWSEGNIDFIKTPNMGPWSHQAGDTSLCTSSGNVVFSLANASDPKTFYITMTYEYGLVIDGDTVFDNSNPPASYTGSNFNVTSTQNAMISDYTITGDFDTLEILANNLCIYEICLEESTLDLNESSKEILIDAVIYPNPINLNEQVFIKNNAIINRLRVSSLSGQVLYNQKTDSDEIHFTIDQRFQSGLYLVSIFTDGMWVHKKLLVK